MQYPAIPPENNHLPRLSPEAYCGFAVVHWTYAIKDRKTNWLNTTFHAKFRERLLHTCARYKLTSPVYCLMPDHMHLLLAGTSPQSDQQKATKFLRRSLQHPLATRNARFQRQAYDRILRDKERTCDAFGRLLHYILDNPVRANLISEKSDWTYSGAMIPGFPDIDPCEEGYSEVYWKLVGQIRE